MLSLVLSTVAFFVASHYIKHFLDDADIPNSLMRSVSIFCVAAAMSYGAAAIVDWIAA